MEESGTAFSILSLNAPGTQGIPDPVEAINVAQRANDALAAFVSRHPQRLGGFAALPMQDPDAAARELERSVRDLGFHGFLVNGFTQLGDTDTIVYYDDLRFNDFWKTVEDLGKPFYLHPRDPLPINARAFQGFPWLGAPTWAFAVETSTHALRLLTSGLFDRYPGLQMILGHMGECIPFHIWRIDHVLQIAPRGNPAQRPVSAYLRDNVHITTSGVFHTPAAIASCSPSIIHSKFMPRQQTGSTAARLVSWTGARSAVTTHGGSSACRNLYCGGRAPQEPDAVSANPSPKPRCRPAKASGTRGRTLMA
jgi:2,3-dihydroxybenzoate decarboxylase